MGWWIWLIAAASVALVVVGAVAWAQAKRIDRLHRRIASARLSLDRHLVKRSAEAVRISESTVLPAKSSAPLRLAATEALSAAQYPLAADTLGGFARQGDGDEADARSRVAAESRLSQVLRRALTDQARQDMAKNAMSSTQLEVLDSASYRVRVARNLHNQDVAAVRRLRAKPLVRVLHLSGHAPLPEFVDLDDE